jgi:hypothetical protein
MSSLLDYHLSQLGNRVCIQRETETRGIWDPTLELTITSPYLIGVSSFPLQQRRMPTNISPIIQKWNNQ